MALDAERRAFELRAAAFRRTRIPNPTLSLFAQNDGFNEHVFGAGLSLPIPLPGNVGRTYLGEIAEAEALAQKAAIDRERLARAIRLEILTALSTFNSRAAEVQAFTSERVTRAHETLRSLGEEVEAGRLSVRDALVAQQALVELLQADVAARRAWCLASVDLARAAGVTLEGETP
jgi:cobalt-zinc-cadmium efflux system outer membrane protein